MIARHWRGWTTAENADQYEALLRNKILPAIRRVPGCQGGYLLRRNPIEDAPPDDVEFVVIHFFDTLDSLQQFAGPDYANAVIKPEAEALLSRADPVAVHYEIRANTLEAY